MSNTTKLFNHPSVEDGYVLETSRGNYFVSISGVQPTALNGQGEEVFWDTSIQSVFDTALENTEKYMSSDFIKGLLVAVQDKVEDFDGQE